MLAAYWLFHSILHRRTKPARCGKKNIEAVTLRRCDEFLEAIVHLFAPIAARPGR
jgi:hypothetical protein